MKNREIKIRVWDEEEKTMSFPMPIAMLAGYILGVKERKENGLGHEIYLQWTGQTDKNSKEICEGDIIEIEFVGRCWVKWMEDASAFFLVSPDNKVATPLLSQHTLNYIVRGNIYQHPELLTWKKKFSKETN